MIYRVSACWARGEFQRHRYEYELWSHVHRQHFVHALAPPICVAMPSISSTTALLALSPINNPLVSYASQAAEILKTHVLEQHHVRRDPPYVTGRPSACCPLPGIIGRPAVRLSL